MTCLRFRGFFFLINLHLVIFLRLSSTATHYFQISASELPYLLRQYSSFSPLFLTLKEGGGGHYACHFSNRFLVLYDENYHNSWTCISLLYVHFSPRLYQVIIIIIIIVLGLNYAEWNLHFQFLLYIWSVGHKICLWTVIGYPIISYVKMFEPE
jgi:hypothetical protein